MTRLHNWSDRKLHTEPTHTMLRVKRQMRLSEKVAAQNKKYQKQSMPKQLNLPANGEQERH